MNLNDAMCWLEENEPEIDKDDVCLISKMPIENEIVLKCGHKFDYKYLYEYMISSERINGKYNKHQCPYCRKKFDGFIPYYEIPSMQIYSLFEEKKRITSRFKNNILKCSHSYKQGKNKGSQCGCSAHNFKIGIYCVKHKNMIIKKENISSKNITFIKENQCQGITSKNIRCKCKSVNGSNYCRHHNGNK